MVNEQEPIQHIGEGQAKPNSLSYTVIYPEYNGNKRRVF